MVGRVLDLDAVVVAQVLAELDLALEPELAARTAVDVTHDGKGSTAVRTSVWYSSL